MKKGIIYFLRATPGILLVFIIWSLLSPDHPPLEYDTVMVDKELYFVLEKKIEFLRVDISTGTGVRVAERVWVVLPPRPFPELRQIKYGQEFGHHVVAPKGLQNNVKYMARIEAPGHSGYRNFIIADENTVIMTRWFDRKRPKNRTVVVERNGKIITVPYSVSFDKDGNKVIVSGPVPAN